MLPLRIQRGPDKDTLLDRLVVRLRSQEERLERGERLNVKTVLRMQDQFAELDSIGGWPDAKTRSFYSRRVDKMHQKMVAQLQAEGKLDDSP
jgi:hypothetical protein